jgi:hypothetical protein
MPVFKKLQVRLMMGQQVMRASLDRVRVVRAFTRRKEKTRLSK